MQTQVHAEKGVAVSRHADDIDVAAVEEALDHVEHVKTVEDIDATDIAPLSFRSPLEWLKSLQDIAATVAFLAMFATIVLGIVMREVVQTPLVWTVAVSTILYIWTILLGSGVVDRDRTHIVFDIVYKMLPPWGRFACRVAGDLFLAVTFSMLILPTVEYLNYMSERKVADLPWLSYQAAFSVFIIFAVLTAAYRLVSVAREIVTAVRTGAPAEEA